MKTDVQDGRLEAFGPWSPGTPLKSYRKVKSAERTLALFELFSMHQRSLTVGEISEALDVPQTSVSMLVRNLTNIGYLFYDSRARAYRPTIRVMFLGGWINRLSPVHDLEARLFALANETAAWVTVGIQNGVYSQYVFGQVPELPERLEIQSGMLRPITRTAVGRMLLSLKADAEIRAIVQRCNAEVTEDRHRVRFSEFMRLIEQIRHQGYARTSGDMTPGYGVVAIDIPGPSPEMPLAVGLGGRSSEMAGREASLVEALKAFKGSTPLV